MAAPSMAARIAGHLVVRHLHGQGPIGAGPPVPVAPAGVAVRGYDRAMQRAMAVVLTVGILQTGLTAAAAPWVYPGWWWLTVGPVLALLHLAVATLGWAGRCTGPVRVGYVLVLIGCQQVTYHATTAAFGVGGAALGPVVLGWGVIGFLERPRRALALGGALVVSTTVALVTTRPDATMDIASLTLIGVTGLLAAIGGGELGRWVAAAEDDARARLAEAVLADRVATATCRDRREARRALHDTVLNTLTALGRARLSEPAAVRERCAADAAFVRSLVTAGPTDDADPPTLAARLDEEAARIRGTGLQVHTTLPPAVGRRLAPEVVRAIGWSVREALNNVREHADAARVTVEASGGADRVVIVVGDDGGAAPVRDDGLGIRRSIVARMADAGGRAEVASVPGRGWTVVLRWPS